MGNTIAIGGTAKEYVYNANYRMTEVKQGGVVTMRYRSTPQASGPPKIQTKMRLGMFTLNLSAKHEDDALELFAHFQTDTFSGKSSAWFSSQQIHDFIAALRKYPVDISSPPILAGGYWDQDGKVVTQEHVYLAAIPKGSRGEVNFRIRLAVPTDMPDTNGELAFSSSATHPVTYLKLDELAHLLQKLLTGETSERIIHIENQ